MLKWIFCENVADDPLRQAAAIDMYPTHFLYKELPKAAIY